MKKAITLFLVIAIAVSLSACGTSPDNSPSTVPTQQTTPKQTPEQKTDSLSNNPKAEDVKTAIESISDIGIIEIVTEDNDPNGQLGKQGGYTGALYFDSPLVEIEDWRDEDYAMQSPIDKGTDCGGCIEIYANTKDAETRDTYLASFDGTAFASYHKVHGTIVIRLSNSLKASQQNDLSQKIIDALSANPTQQATPESYPEPTLDEPKAERTYQSILDEYSEKIRDAVPVLIEEYNTEAAKNEDGLTGLAKISNAKISKLAEMSIEGVGEMAKLMYAEGSGKYDEYEEWAGKLQKVYTEEASKISDAYMESAIG